MKKSIFSPSAIILLIACGLGLLAGSILLHAWDNSPERLGEKYSPSTYSKSAIGHIGFFEILQRLDMPVVRSTGNPLSMVGLEGTLVLAEPNQSHMSSDYVFDFLSAPKILLVLPKWYGLPDSDRPSWIREAVPESLGVIKNDLSLVISNAEIVRTEWPANWETNAIGLTPSGSEVVQLVVSPYLRPIVSTSKGILLGELEIDESIVWVLADPDIMSNSGIFKGQNAAFMATVLRTLHGEEALQKGASIVFDETVHGFRQAQSSPIKLLFQMPYAIVTLLVCCAAGMAVWAGARRFGLPVVPKPVLDFGKGQLLENSANLLDYAGHHEVVMQRYIRLTVRQVAQALHAPDKIDESALVDWLDRVGKARGISITCAEILYKIDNDNSGKQQKLTNLLESADAIYRWKGEILYGSSAGRQHSK